MEDVVKYSKDKFSAEPIRRKARPVQQIGGWHNPSDSLEIKLVFPGFQQQERVLTYRTHIALLFQQTRMEDDLASSTVPQITIRGVGSPDEMPVKRETSSVVKQAVEVGVESVGGIGSIPTLLRSLTRLYTKVLQSSKLHIDLGFAGSSFGNIHMQTRVLPHPSYLARNGFPAKSFAIPEQSSGVLYTDVQAFFTPDEVQAILQQSERLAVRYDRTPRLVVRLQIDESDLKQYGRTPSAEVLWTHAEDKKDAVPVEKVEYVTGD
jgi:hypothetical protein